MVEAVGVKGPTADGLFFLNSFIIPNMVFSFIGSGWIYCCDNTRRAVVLCV